LRNPLSRKGRGNSNDNNKLENGFKGFCAFPQNDRHPELLDCHGRQRALAMTTNNNGNNKLENGIDGFCASASLHAQWQARQPLTVFAFGLRNPLSLNG
jgi:hypothetical protein